MVEKWLHMLLVTLQGQLHISDNTMQMCIKIPKNMESKSYMWNDWLRSPENS